ncbi:hypothetical protein B0H15DRAFT_956129 [Mycena belliarum]|uniref:Uncharacterized protein n=1 Tax=Mycena belliarum TaxID=1033014 RepID=A0AAD6TU99_9AGAR|nr:hypothetical protein B0H15DRAFT_956129 [Mycena belliae]
MHTAGTYAWAPDAAIPSPSTSDAIRATHTPCVPNWTALDEVVHGLHDGGVACASPRRCTSSNTFRAAGACALSLLIMMIVTTWPLQLSAPFRALTTLYAIARLRRRLGSPLSSLLTARSGDG